MTHLKFLRRATALALAAFLSTPFSASAASYDNYSSDGNYGVSEFGEWAPPPFGAGLIPVLQFGHRDYIPQSPDTDQKFPFVLITTGFGGDGRYFGDTYAKKLASRGFAVRIGYGATNSTFATPEFHLSQIGLDISQGHPSPLAEKADFSRSALVGYSAGAGASLWAGATQGGVSPSLGAQIPGFALGAMVDMGLPVNYYAAEPLVPAELPVLIVYGEYDVFGLGGLSHQIMHSVAENKNQTIIGVRGADHMGGVTQYPVDLQSRYFTVMTAWLEANLKGDRSAKDGFRNGDPEIIRKDYFTIYDQTSAARNS